MNAELLADIESCERRAYWSQNWEPNKLHPTEILRRSIAEALVDPEREDRGENAGEIFMQYCAKGLDTKQHNKYDQAIHHAAIADIVTTYLSAKGRYSRPRDVVGVNLTWHPWCLERAGELVRVVLVDYWNEDREASEARAWWTLAEMAAYKMPMTLEIILLGASSGGRRHSHWTRAILHPRNLELRFKKKAKKIEGFKDTWTPIYREDRAEISREAWLAGMEKDDAIQDVTRTIHVNAFSAERVRELRAIIERKTERLYKINEVPDPNFSACNWPRPCSFQWVCFAPKPTTPEATGLYRHKASS